MVGRSAVNREIQDFLQDLEELGFPVARAYLFGSMIHGNPHKYSDIDLAVWSEGFSMNYFENIEKTASLKRRYKRIELHPFQLKDTSANNPFIATIEMTGKKVELGIDTV